MGAYKLFSTFDYDRENFNKEVTNSNQKNVNLYHYKAQLLNIEILRNHQQN